jgi:uncharacterized protein (TIGR03437 family)
LYSIAVSGFQPEPINLGLNPSDNLPTELNGVQVMIRGEPASILAIGTGQIIVAAPRVLPAIENSPSDVTAVQVIYNGVPSNLVWMPVSSVLPGLLTVDFPNLPTTLAAPPDANALNPDGTQNDASHPAAAGSTITLFVTGMGAAAGLFAPGSIAQSDALSPVTPIYSPWENATPEMNAIPLAVSSVPGFVSAVFQVQVPIPSNIQNLGGTDAGNGVQRVEVGLLLDVNLEINFPVSNLVGVYVQ